MKFQNFSDNPKKEIEIDDDLEKKEVKPSNYYEANSTTTTDSTYSAVQ